MTRSQSTDVPPTTPEAPVPATRSLTRLRAAARECRACPLYAAATQTVFGEGRREARLVMVGEQPGDIEDREGRPFVGPAGRLLDRAMSDAGLGRDDVYLTNAVKHFKFSREGGGKRRIHQAPDARELAACRPWLAAELTAVRPAVLAVLGASAAHTVLGRTFSVMKHRGEVIPGSEITKRTTEFEDRDAGAALDDTLVIPTVHPSAVLRSPDRDTAYAAFVADLTVMADVCRNDDASGPDRNHTG